MRVCHISSVHLASDVRILCKECRSLAAAGYETHLVAIADSNHRDHDVMVHAVPTRWGGRLARLLITGFQVFRMANSIRASIYHIHDPELLPIAILLRLCGAEVVYDAHEDLPRDLQSKDWIPKLLLLPLSIVVNRVELWLARRLSAVVAATPTIRDRFAAAGCHAVAVRNFPVLGEFHPASSGDLSQRSRSGVGYIGDITRIRGSRVMVEAAARAGVELSLAGRLRDEERRVLEAMPGWRRVRYRGQLTRPQVAKMLNECFAGLVILSPKQAYRESLPIKLFEYMAAGIPVIASDFGAWRRIVQGAGCGLCVDPTDPEAVASAIRELDGDRSRAREMGMRGYTAFLENYNWSSEEIRLLTLYGSLISMAAHNST